MAIDIKLNRNGKVAKHKMAIGLDMLRKHAAIRWPDREYEQSAIIKDGFMTIELSAHGR